MGELSNKIHCFLKSLLQKCSILVGNRQTNTIFIIYSVSKLEHYPLPAVASSVCCALSVSGDRLLQGHRFFGSSGELIAVIFC